MLHVRLFGHLSVQNMDAPGPHTPVDLSMQQGCLLARLALARGRFFPRSELLCSLWPEQEQASNFHMLNTALWRLRKTLKSPPLNHSGIVLSDRSGAVGLPAHGGLTLDVEAFAQGVKPALHQQPGELGPTDMESLRQCVDLYSDDMLSGASQGWVVRARDMYRHWYLRALDHLVHWSTQQHDYGAAIQYAQAILESDTLREDVHRDLMRLYLLVGQRARALLQFESCRNALRRELAIQPMQETFALYQSIADGAIGHAHQSLRGGLARRAAD